MAAEDPVRASYLFRQKVRMGDVPGVKGLLKAGHVDITAPGNTKRQWTPLHIACWGSVKPGNDKEIVEAILLYAQKMKIEDQVRAAKDAILQAVPNAKVAAVRVDEYPITVTVSKGGETIWSGRQQGLFGKNGRPAQREIIEALRKR